MTHEDEKNITPLTWAYLGMLILSLSATIFISSNLVKPLMVTALSNSYPATITEERPRMPQGCDLVVSYNYEGEPTTGTVVLKKLPCEQVKRENFAVSILPGGALKMTPPTYLLLATGMTAGLTFAVAALSFLRLFKLVKRTHIRKRT